MTIALEAPLTTTHQNQPPSEEDLQDLATKYSEAAEAEREAGSVRNRLFALSQALKVSLRTAARAAGVTHETAYKALRKHLVDVEPDGSVTAESLLSELEKAGASVKRAKADLDAVELQRKEAIAALLSWERENNPDYAQTSNAKYAKRTWASEETVRKIRNSLQK